MRRIFIWWLNCIILCSVSVSLCCSWQPHHRNHSTPHENVHTKSTDTCLSMVDKFIFFFPLLGLFVCLLCCSFFIMWLLLTWNLDDIYSFLMHSCCNSMQWQLYRLYRALLKEDQMRWKKTNIGKIVPRFRRHNKSTLKCIYNSLWNEWWVRWRCKSLSKSAFSQKKSPKVKEISIVTLPNEITWKIEEKTYRQDANKTLNKITLNDSPGSRFLWQKPNWKWCHKADLHK